MHVVVVEVSAGSFTWTIGVAGALGVVFPVELRSALVDCVEVSPMVSPGSAVLIVNNGDWSEAGRSKARLPRLSNKGKSLKSESFVYGP